MLHSIVYFFSYNLSASTQSVLFLQSSNYDAGGRSTWETQTHSLQRFQAYFSPSGHNIKTIEYEITKGIEFRMLL